MSQDAEQETLFKSPKRLIIAVIAGFLIPITVIGLIISYVHNISLPGAGTDAMSASSVTQRIAPVAQVAIQELPASAISEVTDKSTSSSESANETAIAAAIAAIPSAASAAAGQGSGAGSAAAQPGKVLYTQICQTCHATGLAGAPKFGNKADWAPRLKSPKSEIYQIALKGKGGMPPKGGSNATDEEVKAAVDYMLKAVK